MQTTMVRGPAAQATLLAHPATHGTRAPHGTALVRADPALAAPSPPAVAQAPLDLRHWLNVALALVALILALPLMLVIALVIRLTSPGPIFYTQLRVGLDRRTGEDGAGFRRGIDYGGQLFRIYKFRTMEVGADRGGQAWATNADPRVTPVGRVLRKFRLDELPQLINVLRGEMNIVGPRPEQPDIVISLRARIDRYQDRQRVLPGITGWAQVNQHYDRNLDDVRRKVGLDLEYISRCSALEDLRILLRTVPVVLLQRGAL